MLVATLRVCKIEIMTIVHFFDDYINGSLTKVMSGVLLNTPCLYKGVFNLDDAGGVGAAGGDTLADRLFGFLC